MGSTQIYAIKPKPKNNLVRELERILADAVEGKVIGAAIMTDRHNGRIEYTLGGTYADTPSEAYLPMCKAVLDLASKINCSSCPDKPPLFPNKNFLENGN